MNTGAASSDGDRLDHEHRPDAGPDAAAAAEPGEHRPDRAGDGRRAAQDLDERVAASRSGRRSTGSAPLSRSPATTTAAHLPPERPQRIRAAGPARSRPSAGPGRRRRGRRARRPGSSPRGRRRASATTVWSTSAGSTLGSRPAITAGRCRSRRSAPESSTGRQARLGCAPRDAARTIDRDDPPARAASTRSMAPAPRRSEAP